MSRPLAAGAPHVLLTTDAVGGVWTYALDLGQGLVKAGMRATLAVMGPVPDGSQQAAAHRAAANRAGLHLVELGGALDWTASDQVEVAASARALAGLAARLGPDLIHLNSPALLAFGPLGAPVLAACHSCVKSWWTAVKDAAPLPSDLAWRAALTARGYAAADALLAPSHAFAQVTQAAYALVQLPHVVLNGRTPILPPEGRGTPLGGVEEVAPTPAEDPLSPLRGQLPQGGSIFTAGRLWDEGKDIATLDRAARRSPDLMVAAAGPALSPTGDGRAWPHLHLLGPLDSAAISARLATRPIFVSPSLYEPFGLAVLEAAQAGCALVLSDIPTFRELWGGAADLFPPGDDAALAAQLARLAADPARRRAQGDLARTRASRYTAQAMTDATLGLYAKLSPAFAGARAVA